MYNCWRHAPNQRPSFNDLVQQLTTLVKTADADNDNVTVKQLLDNVYEIHTELPGEKC